MAGCDCSTVCDWIWPCVMVCDRSVCDGLCDRVSLCVLCLMFHYRVALCRQDTRFDTSAVACFA